MTTLPVPCRVHYLSTRRKGFFVSLVLVLLALVGIVHANDDTTGTTVSRVRGRRQEEKQQQQQQQQERKLAEFRTPFTITWRIAIGNGGTDRQPTPQEYEWVVEATTDWFLFNIEENYGNVAGLELSDLEATLVMDQTSWVPDSRDFPHQIFIELEAVWEADNAALVPDVVDFLVTLNDNSSVRDFIVDYLLVTGTDSVFHFSQRVSYTTASIPAPGVPTPPTPSPPVPAPQPTAPQPTPNFANGWIIPVKLTFDLAIGMGRTDRLPTEEEYTGFQMTVDQWLLESLRAAYASETEFFAQNIESFITDNSWDATRTSPHQIVVEAFIVYTADTLSQVPTIVEFFATLRSPAVSFPAFIDPYLRNAEPSNNIFRATVSGGYTSTQNGPRFSSAITANPAAPPVAPTPTLAPVRATPAPVNPNQVIVSSVTVRSNWTYSVGGSFGIDDRQPTQDDYLGLVDSTHEWLNRIMREHYNDASNAALNLPFFVGAETSFVQGIYRPNEQQQHLVVKDVTFTFALDENDETEIMPFIDDIFDVVEAADLNQYVFLYVHTSEPIETSVFHGVDSVNWVYSVDEYTYVPRPTRPPTPGNGDQGMGSYTGIDRTQLDNADWVSVSLLMQYRLTDAAAATAGAATSAEWAGLEEATRRFWIDTFEEEFQNNPASNFVIVDAKWETDSTMYDPNADLYKYRGRFVTDILFSEGSVVLSSIAMRQRMVNMLSGSSYIAQYVHTINMPVDNLFRQTLQVGWDF